MFLPRQLPMIPRSPQAPAEPASGVAPSDRSTCRRSCDHITDPVAAEICRYTCAGG